VISVLSRCDQADGDANFWNEYDRIDKLNAKTKQKQTLREKLGCASG